MEIVEHPAASALRIAANRRNAEESTGPRTPAGKRRTAQNALKLGWHSPAANAWAPKHRAETPEGLGAGGGLGRGARRRAGSGGRETKPAQGRKGGEKMVFETKPMGPLRINMNFRKSLETKAMAILQTIPTSPARLSYLSPASDPPLAARRAAVETSATVKVGRFQGRLGHKARHHRASRAG